MNNDKTNWRPATVVSLKGLRRRARGSYHLGMKVSARFEDCGFCGGEGKLNAGACPGCGGEKKRTIVHGTGIAGTDAIVSAGMIRFDDGGAR